MASIFALKYFGNSEHVIRNLTTDITVTSKVFIDKPERKYIATSLKSNNHHAIDNIL